MDIQGRDIMLVLVTASNQEEAAKISEQAVQSRLAACATMVPSVQSLYRWEGKVVNDQEVLVLLKTTADKYSALQDSVRKMHSYEVPEILGISVDKGLPQYLEWVRQETT